MNRLWGFPGWREMIESNQIKDKTGGTIMKKLCGNPPYICEN
jgi:hypothetical protein